MNATKMRYTGKDPEFGQRFFAGGPVRRSSHRDETGSEMFDHLPSDEYWRGKEKAVAPPDMGVSGDVKSEENVGDPEIIHENSLKEKSGDG